MQLETAFNMLCDFSSEIVPYEKSVIYFWDETTEQVGLRVTRGEVDPRVATLPHGNIFNFWVTKFDAPFSSVGDRTRRRMRCCAPWTQPPRSSFLFW